jgi:uncharacterized membrane protein
MARRRSGVPGLDDGQFDLRHGRPERLNTLIDGVYAIIMTILVLDLKLPEGLTPADATVKFYALAPRFEAFVVSFGVAAAGWAYAHTVAPLFKRSNLTHVALNLLALMFASLIPFCASVLGSLPDSILGPQSYALVVAAQTGVYMLDLIVCQRELIPTAVSRRFLYLIIGFGSAAALYIASIGLFVAPRYPGVALGLIVLHFVIHWTLLFVFARPIHEAVHRAEAPRAD